MTFYETCWHWRSKWPCQTFHHRRNWHITFNPHFFRLLFFAFLSLFSLSLSICLFLSIFSFSFFCNLFSFLLDFMVTADRFINSISAVSSSRIHSFQRNYAKIAIINVGQVTMRCVSVSWIIHWSKKKALLFSVWVQHFISEEGNGRRRRGNGRRRRGRRRS